MLRTKSRRLFQVRTSLLAAAVAVSMPLVASAGADPSARIDSAEVDLGDRRLTLWGRFPEPPVPDTPRVSFDGQEIPVVSHSGGEIVAELPAAVGAGTHRVVIILPKKDSADGRPQGFNVIDVAIAAGGGAIPDGAVTTDKIADGAVTVEKLSPDVPLGGFFRDAALTDERIAWVVAAYLREYHDRMTSPHGIGLLPVATRIFPPFIANDPIVPQWGNAVVTKHHTHEGGRLPLDLGDGNTYMVENADPLSTNAIQDGAITTVKLADNAVTTAKITDNAVATAKLADNAVTNAKIANLAVDASKITTGAVGSSQLATNAVVTSRITDNAVTAAKLADNAVTPAKLADSAVTNAKIADLAVNASKITTGAVGSSQLATNAVVTSKITDNAVTAAKLADNAVSTAKLADNSVTNAKIADGAISSEKLESFVFVDTLGANDVSASSIGTQFLFASFCACDSISTGSSGPTSPLSSEQGTLAGPPGVVTQTFKVSNGGPYEPGDVVVIDPEASGFVRLSYQAEDSGVVGVVAPGTSDAGGEVVAAILGMGGDGSDAAALVVKVDASFGAIAPGDPLTTSSTPGHAMKASAPKTGRVLGKALEPLGEGRGLIRVFVSLS
jgi:hypothetical protein